MRRGRLRRAGAGSPAASGRASGCCATGSPAPVPVVTGLDDDSFTEIVSGELAPGDQVVTAEQNAAGGRTALPRLRF